MKMLSDKHQKNSRYYTGFNFTLNLITSLMIFPVCGYSVAAGNNHYVDATSTVTSWNISGDNLFVSQGGETKSIRLANNSTLNMDGGKSSIGNSARELQTVTLQGASRATITGSTIINSQTGRSSIAFGSNGGSHATITDSTLMANGRGFTISGPGSFLNLFNTTSIGSDNGRTGQFDGGQGGSIFDGTLIATDSRLTGDRNGLRIVLDEDSSVPVAILNNTTVTGNNSSAIVLGTTSNSYGKGVIELQVNNGSILNSGNNTIIEAIGDNTANIFIDNSQLAGDITSGEPTKVNVVLKNQASLQGDMKDINTLNIDNSLVTGDIHLKKTGDAQVQLTKDARILGNINNIDYFSANHSQLIGNLIADNARPGFVSLMNSSEITGDLKNITDITLDNSVINGNIASDGSLATQVNLQNNSVIEGNLSQIIALTLDSSQVNGDIRGHANGTAKISLLNGSVIRGELSSVHTLNLADSQLTGNVLSDGTAGSSVTLEGQTALTGHIDNFDFLSVRNDAVWNMVQSAKVGNLALSNGGQINLNSTDGNYRTLTASHLSGEGTFTLNTNIAEQTGDRLIINGEADGSYNLGVFNSGKEPLHDNSLILVNTGGGNGVFSLENDVVDAGVYEYKLLRQGNDWALVKTDEITPSVKTILSLFNATPLVWNGELDSVRSRLGYIRMTTNYDSGLWIQYLGQQTNVSPRAGTSYKQKQFGLTLGADKSHEITNGKLLTGLFTGYSDNQINGNYGKGNIDSFYAGAYATWLSDSGWFLDTTIKGNQFHNIVNAQMSDGQRGRSNYNNYGIGLSAELGKNIRLYNGWFVEPSAQLTSLWVSGNHYRLDNDMKAENDSARSRQAVFNLVAGKDITLSNGMVLAPYAKAGYQYEFAKDNKVHVNDISFSNDMSGGTGILGIGLNAQLSDKSWIYADLDYAKGPKAESPWTGNIGIRINW